MNAPLSRFQMISRLCARDGYAVEALSRFKRVCIVIHDPDDSQFVTMLQRRLNRLCMQFGNDLLFMSFVKPPGTWKNGEGTESSEIETRHLYAEAGFDSWSVINHLLPFVAPDANLPCILLTEDLLSRDYLLLECSSDSFVETLSKLQGEDSMPDSCRRCSLPDRSLAEYLTDVLALHEYCDDDARKWGDGRIRQLKEKGNDVEAARYEAGIRRPVTKELDELPDSSLGHGLPEFFGFPDFSGLSERFHRSVRPTTEKPRRPSLYADYYIDTNSISGYNYCNVKSRGSLQQYNKLLDSFIPKRCRDEAKVTFEDDGITLRDFSPLGMNIGLFFEYEINMTVVQLMRQALGIEMPEYYWKFKKGAWANVETGGGKNVALNACEKPDRLKPLMLGDALNAYKTLCEKQTMIDLMGTEFLRLWQTITYLRNKCNHAKFYNDFGYEEFKQLHSAFSTILANHLLRMEEIGQALKNGWDEIAV